MKVLVFGAREWGDWVTMRRVLTKLPPDTILVNGKAKGADIMSSQLGRELGFEVREYPVTDDEWLEHGKAAGVLRNGRMLAGESPDSQGVFVDKAFGFSTGRHNRGTSDMADRLWRARVRFEILFPLV
jgi:hypothetical protein